LRFKQALTIAEKYMNRCLQLAESGAGVVAPNPMVGAVLVYEDRVIGEGYHEMYGGPHAEVNCIASVSENNKQHIQKSTMYVSLEPCAHFGKTPPCTGLIIKNRIPKVVIGCHDPFKQVDGKGIEKLKAAGVMVELGVLEKECIRLNKRFFTFHQQQRPYIILKWAETADGFIATSPPTPLQRRGAFADPTNSRLFISNDYSNRLVHKWRSEEAAILVGTNTALLDNPELTTRLWTGNSPMRLVLDMNLRLPDSLKLFDGTQQTIIFNTIREGEEGNLHYYKIDSSADITQQICTALFKLKIPSVIVEGGAKLLQSFIDADLWDETRVIVNQKLFIANGLSTPVLQKFSSSEKIDSTGDDITICYR
jgi:diaminohydroxyphosphoribosylaminopyrimidine deaminase / 5-amino-6-(5-phosphoribosylamino)uracil reductase